MKILFNILSLICFILAILTFIGIYPDFIQNEFQQIVLGYLYLIIGWQLNFAGNYKLMGE